MGWEVVVNATKQATLQNNVAVAATQAALTGHAWYAHCQCLQLLQKPWLKLRGMGKRRYKLQTRKDTRSAVNCGVCVCKVYSCHTV